MRFRVQTSVMKVRLVEVLGAALAALVALGLNLGHAQAPGPQSFAAAETLTYEVDWSVFTAGKIVARLAGTDQDGPSEIITSARSQGVASLLYKVQDEYHSFFNPQTLCSRRISKKVSEGSRHREMEIAFNSDQGVAVVDERDLNAPNAPPRHIEHAVPPCAEDMVTAFYFMRRQPLHVGQEIRLAVNDGGETQAVVVEVQAEDQLQTALGSRRAIRVEPKIFGSLYKRKGRLLVWFSDDEQHLPLRLRLTVSVGTITANLKSVSSAPMMQAPVH